MRRNFFVIPLMLILIMLPFFATKSYADNPSLVQNAIAGAANTTSTVAHFSTNVAAGDTIIVTAGFVSTSAITINTPIDSLSLTWTLQKANAINGNAYAYIWSAQATTSGSETITISSSANSWMGLVAYEFNAGPSPTFVTSSSNGQGCSCDVVSYNTFAATVAIAASQWTSSGGIWTCSGSYTCVSNLITSTNQVAGEYSATTSGSNNLPMSFTQNNVQYWAESALSIYNPIVYTTLTTTTSVFAVNAPNPNTAQYWIFGLLALFAPVGLLDGILLEREKAQIDSNTLIFMTLLGLLTGSILGLLMNVLPFGITLALAALFVIYMWRGRG